MGLFDKIRGEFIDIVEWLDDSQNTMVYRFRRHGNEIKYGAQLVVREGQMAVFINRGEIADVFKPGKYTLTTENMPILTTLKGWKYGFKSPFKAEVYFISTRQFTSLKWGTPGPCTMRDQEFGAVRVTAFGIYSLRVKDPEIFIREIVGTDGHFTTEEIEENLRGKLGMMVKEVIPDAGIPVLDLEGKVVTLGEILRERMIPSFEKYGLNLTEVQVQDIGLPEEVEKAIDKGGAMRALGDLGAYTQYEAASSMRDAANNPSGTAGAGMGMGMGFAMANQMGQSMNQAQQQAGPGAPPPLPAQSQYFVAVDGKQAGPFDMATLGDMAAQGQLSGATLVWQKGMAEWTAAEAVDELKSLFDEAPPPLPGA